MLVTNKFNVLFYSTAELKIYHLSHYISTQDTFGITDPRSMQDAYHTHMNLVSGVARQRIPSSSSVDGGSDWQNRNWLGFESSRGRGT